MTTSLAITGAAGRMGTRLVALARADGAFDVVGAIERPDHPMQARDVGELAGLGPIGVPVSYDLKRTPAVPDRFHRPGAPPPLAEDLPRPGDRDGDRHDGAPGPGPRGDRPRR